MFWGDNISRVISYARRTYLRDTPAAIYRTIYMCLVVDKKLEYTALVLYRVRSLSVELREFTRRDHHLISGTHDKSSLISRVFSSGFIYSFERLFRHKHSVSVLVFIRACRAMYLA